MAIFRKELESRLQKGDTGVIMKYIKGNPQIINYKNL